jgi:hypothetical protein
MFERAPDKAAPPEDQQKKESHNRRWKHQRKRKKAIDPCAKAASHVVHDPCREHPQEKRGYGRSARRGQRNDER